MGIPEVAAAPNGTRFGCCLFFDANFTNDNKTIQNISAFIKNSATSITTLGGGNIVHPTQGCDFYKVVFDSTGVVNEYYTHISGQSFVVMTNRGFNANSINFVGFVIV
jgi:hypothetical protein